jgi:hypothetical protein
LGAVSSTAYDRERLLQAIGEAALVARDLKAARDAFEEVVASARRENRHARVAQQYVRLAVVDVFSGRFAEGPRDINAALAATVPPGDPLGADAVTAFRGRGGAGAARARLRGRRRG